MHFVATGLLSPELGKFYSKLFELRQTGDYDDWVVVTEEDVLSQSQMVEPYFEAVTKLISEN